MASVSLELPRAAEAHKPVGLVNLAGLTRAELQAALTASGLTPPDKARMRTN